MRRMMWVWCVWWLCRLGTGWAAEYQVIDLGPEWRPLAISAAGDIAVAARAVSRGGTLVARMKDVCVSRMGANSCCRVPTLGTTWYM